MPIAIGEGKSGTIIKIIEPNNYSNLVVKIFHKNKINDNLIGKIKYLTQSYLSSDSSSIVCPKNLVYENGDVVGYTMDFINGVPLNKLFLEKWWLKPESETFKRLNPFDNNTFFNRIKLCLNISIAVNYLHNFKKWSLIDLKPSNIILSPEGLVRIIDIDNAEIANNSSVLYYANCFDIDFAPPELYKGPPINNRFCSNQWDLFSMAIIFYQIICNISPFTGVCNLPQEECSDTSIMIQKGLWPFGSNSRMFVRFHSNHNRYLSLPKHIKNLFIQCFDDGITNPKNRPPAKDWAIAFSGQFYNSNRPQNSESVIKEGGLSGTYNNIINYKPSKLHLVTFKSIDYISFYKINFEWKIFILRVIRKPKLLLKYDKITSEVNNYNVTRDRIITELSELINLHGIVENKIKIYAEMLSVEINNIINDNKAKLKIYLDKIDSDLTLNSKRELEKLFDIENEFNSKTNNEIKNLAIFENDLLGPVNLELEANERNYKNGIENIAREKQISIEERIFNHKKFDEHVISREYGNIFGKKLDIILRQLLNNSIRTASDFIDVSSEGRIKLKSNIWVKIDGLGKERANQLYQWRRAIEIRLRKDLKSELDDKYSDKVKKLEANYNKTIEICGLKLISSKNRIKIKQNEVQKRLDKIELDKKGIINGLKQEYDDKFRMCKMILKDYLEKMLNKINLDNLEFIRKYTLSKNESERELHTIYLKYEEIKNQKMQLDIRYHELCRLLNSYDG